MLARFPGLAVILAWSGDLNIMGPHDLKVVAIY
jgi:hypothetical protein